MIIRIEEKAWLNQKCNECGELIYPDEVYILRPEGKRISPLIEWKFCKKCFKKIFKEAKNDKQKQN